LTASTPTVAQVKLFIVYCRKIW